MSKCFYLSKTIYLKCSQLMYEINWIDRNENMRWKITNCIIKKQTLIHLIRPSKYVFSYQ